MDELLRVEGLGINFGGLRAVSDFSLHLETGSLAGLIGPNGAGKTTVFNMLTGVYEPTDGQILFRDIHEKERILNGLASHEITRLGIARTFQNIRLFHNLTVLENVSVSHHFRVAYNPIQGILRTPLFRREEARIREQSLEILKIFEIEQKANVLSGSLPYGQQRKLEIVRALATSPRLLLLDEPAAGMNPQETKDLMSLIAFIRERFHLTILLIEHDMNLVMGLCESLTVLDYGRVIAQGKPDSVRKNPDVIRAYLGEDIHA